MLFSLYYIVTVIIQVIDKKIDKLSFEKSMSRLEEIISNLERGDVELENAIELYTEGVKLQEHCNNKINYAKMKVDKIIKNNGSIEKVDYKS